MKKTTFHYTCDIDGDEAKYFNVPFSFDGKSYELDLCQKHYDELRAIMASYREHARKIVRQVKHIRTVADRRRTAEMRAWWFVHWKEAGLPKPESDRGRMPDVVPEAYYNAMQIRGARKGGKK